MATLDRHKANLMPAMYDKLSERFPFLMKGAIEVRSVDGFSFGKVGQIFFIHYPNDVLRAFNFQKDQELVDQMQKIEESLKPKGAWVLHRRGDV